MAGGGVAEPEWKQGAWFLWLPASPPTPDPGLPSDTHLRLLGVLEKGASKHVQSLPRRSHGPQHKPSRARAPHTLQAVPG